MSHRLKHSDGSMWGLALLMLVIGAMLGIFMGPDRVEYRYITSDAVKNVYSHRGVDVVNYNLMWGRQYGLMTENVSVTLVDGQRFSADSKEFGAAFTKVSEFLKNSAVVIYPSRGSQ